MAKHDWCDYLPNAFRNLHKKAFNSLHYNVVCCQSLTHLARNVLSLSSTPGAEANWNWIFKQPKGARRAPVGGCWLVKYSSNEISINIIKIHFVVVAVEVRVRRLLHCISSWFIHECESIKLTFLAGWKTGEMANGSALWSSSWLQCCHSESVALFKILSRGDASAISLHRLFHSLGIHKTLRYSFNVPKRWQYLSPPHRCWRNTKAIAKRTFPSCISIISHRHIVLRVICIAAERRRSRGLTFIPPLSSILHESESTGGEIKHP